MSSENTASNFERASRVRLRIVTSVGTLAVEDLWGLPLTSTRTASLDDVAKSLRRVIKDREEESFVTKPSKANEELQLSFDIVKHIIEVRLAENEEARVKEAKKAQKVRLQELIAEKQDESLKGKSVEELQALVEAL